MKPSPKMQQMIEQLAARHGVDLTKLGASFRLEMPHFDRLCIENIGAQRISVAHYFECNGDLVAEPDVVFYTCDTGWYPTEITQSLTGWQPVAELRDGSIVRCAVRAQRDVAEFCEIWATNITEQGWLDDGQLTRVDQGGD